MFERQNCRPYMNLMPAPGYKRDGFTFMYYYTAA